MDERYIPDAIPEVPVSLGLPPSLVWASNPGHPLHGVIQETVIRELAGLMDRLGIPGQPTMEFAVLPERRRNMLLRRRSRLLRLSIHGQVCRYPIELLRSVYGYVHGIHPDPKITPERLLAWLGEPGGEDGSGETRGEFLGLACLAIVQQHPAALLGPAQTEAYRVSLPAPAEVQPDGWLPNAAWLRQVLGTVLDQRISIADRQTVAGVLAQSRGHSPEDAAEDLLTALRPEVVAIHIPWEYLQQLTVSDSGQGKDLVPAMRKDLLAELGVPYVPFQLVRNEGLKPETFAFQINHLMTLPFLGLRPGECLANDTAERLRRLDVQARLAENPATSQPSSIVDAEHKSKLEAAGLTTWDPVQFFILCFIATLRKYGASFLDYKAVDGQLEQLRLTYPTLVEATRARWPVEQITRVLRAMASEELSIRNLRQILERLLDFDFRASDALRYLVLDDRPNTPRGVDEGSDTQALVSFVRAGLKREIGHKYARGTNRLAAYLLDAEIEALVSRQQKASADDDALDEHDADRIVEAIQQEIANLPPTAQIPVILTTETARPRLHELVAAEFPRVAVVSYTELAAELNVQPVARISLKR
jgi:hypothetical protein